jgi:hypothetical protein
MRKLRMPDNQPEFTTIIIIVVNAHPAAANDLKFYYLHQCQLNDQSREGHQLARHGLRQTFAVVSNHRMVNYYQVRVFAKTPNAGRVPVCVRSKFSDGVPPVPVEDSLA